MTLQGYGVITSIWDDVVTNEEKISARCILDNYPTTHVISNNQLSILVCNWGFFPRRRKFPHIHKMKAFNANAEPRKRYDNPAKRITTHRYR